MGEGNVFSLSTSGGGSLSRLSPGGGQSADSARGAGVGQSADSAGGSVSQGGQSARGGQLGGSAKIGQQNEYSLHGRQYASCVHAGGLSCLHLIS